MPNRAGSAHPAAKLTEEDVQRMRAARARGDTVEAVYRRFSHLGVSFSLVSKILAGRAWKHVL